MSRFAPTEDWLAVGIPEDIVDEALRWIVTLDSETVSEDQKQQFTQWLEGDLLHRWAYQELSEMWAASASLEAVDVGVAQVVDTASTAVADGIKWWQSVLTVSLVVVGIVLGITN